MSKVNCGTFISSSFAHALKWVVALFATVLLFTPSAYAAEVGWRRDLQANYRQSALQNKPIFVVVGAHWCGYCRQLQEQTLRNPSLVSRINDRFIPVLIDADEQPELTQQLQVESMPTILIISPERRIVYRSSGFLSAGELDSRLAQLTPAARKPSTLSLLRQAYAKSTE